ncbi:Endonuclease/exonuclease/phosphatase [Trema orientale]|uniref:Endonuclease/exonuclease/phosphatase n=1 Tax=Trema orientale TaxID=63057 RepID=A0A2P5C6I5_TREOI|nr:Endonuclease/exonuclease/phosphatase [Trema orientale]
MLLWKNGWNVTIHSFSNGHIDAPVVTEEKVHWRFTGFYGHPSQSKRKFSWDLLRRLNGLFSLPWVCGGDFNEILCLSEKVRGSEEGLMHTWTNKRDGLANIQEQLDRYVYNDEWRTLFPNASVKHLDFFLSDHRPVVLSISKQTLSYGSGERPFRLEPFWVNETDFNDVVQQSWQNSVVNDRRKSFSGIATHLQFCGASLKLWSSKRFGRWQKLLGSKQRQLASLYDRSREVGVMKKIRRVEKEIGVLLYREEQYWKQRSRADWLLGRRKY